MSKPENSWEEGCAEAWVHRPIVAGSPTENIFALAALIREWHAKGCPCGQLPADEISALLEGLVEAATGKLKPLEEFRGTQRTKNRA